MKMLQPKTVIIKTLEDDEREYTISKFPAVAGREIIAQYPLSFLPKVGDYKVNEEMMLKIMSYVGVAQEGKDEPLRLSTRALIDNHVPDWEALARLELAVMDYNCSFFRSGRASTFFSGLGAAASTRITEILTGLLEKLSPAAEQLLKNSGKNTPLKTPFTSGKR